MKIKMLISLVLFSTLVSAKEEKTLDKQEIRYLLETKPSELTPEVAFDLITNGGKQKLENQKILFTPQEKWWKTFPFIGTKGTIYTYVYVENGEWTEDTGINTFGEDIDWRQVVYTLIILLIYILLYEWFKSKKARGESHS